MIRLTIIMLSVLILTTPAWSQKPLLLGIHPFLPYETLEKKFAPLAAYLGQELDRLVIVRIGSSYQDHIDATGHDQVDMAYLGPAEYVMLVEKYGPRPLIACQETDGETFFRGVVVVRNDSPATSLAALEEGEFAFVDRHSTMGYLVPLAMLQQENPHLIAERRYRFLKTHEDVALGVLAGDFAAGAVKEAVFQRFKTRGLKMLTATPAVAEYLFVASSTMPAMTVERLRLALLNLKMTAEGRQVLYAIKESLTGFSPVCDADYDSLRQMLALPKQEEGVGNER
ncbi:MAG: phosphate/phosphite/phosphonate ABC transporter substrate-binding protein [Deltaproteobacteria bacterium]|nr:phosphate/phosphite/phosphonate ABC transporter substrate-binding protein [Candidatus Anaeroferrophillus wilburensis]MBN2889184.1 phosphate/phosphite/phosphonate ABC transporter substrate-binding protein [Deltaproteobacteria bacterium]